MRNPDQPLWELWDLAFYPCDIQGHPASVWLDPSIPHHVDRSKYPYFHALRVGLRSPTENGLSSSAERPQLVEIEERVIPLYEQAIEGVYVGRVTTNGHRDFYFQGTREKLSDDLRDEILARFPDYEFAGGDGIRDPSWHEYFSCIYPNDLAYQFIMLQRTFERLTTNDENVDVLYFYYFDDDAAFQTAREQIEQLDEFALHADTLSPRGPFRLVATYHGELELLTVYRALERMACSSPDARTGFSHCEFPSETAEYRHLSASVGLRVAADVAAGLRDQDDLRKFGLDVGESPESTSG